MVVLLKARITFLLHVSVIDEQIQRKNSRKWPLATKANGGELSIATLCLNMQHPSHIDVFPVQPRPDKSIMAMAIA